MIFRLRRETFIFNSLQLFIVCFVKSCLFIATNVHVGNLESSRDMCFLTLQRDDERTPDVIISNPSDPDSFVRTTSEGPANLSNSAGSAGTAVRLAQEELKKSNPESALT